MRRSTRTFIASLTVGLGLSCGDALGPIGELPRELSLGEQELVAADNQFAFGLFRQVVQQEGGANVFISPLSVAMALGMTYNGAAGMTREAMQEALELRGMTLDDVNRAYLSLIDLLRALDPSVEFLLANSIWYADRLTPLAEFLDVNRTYFKAEVTGLDFGSPSAAPTINAWVKDQTQNKIESIVPDPIPGDVVMYLINAIYFKGAWTYQFDKDLTQDAPFRRPDGSQVTVKMMSRNEEASFRASRDGGVQLVDLAYGGGAYRMLIAVPDDPAGLEALVPDLSNARWNAWVTDLDSVSGFVSLPRFTLEYELVLNDVLSALGMEIAFRPGADFSNMYQGGGVWIDEVRHKTFVDVNEEGTEAAAVTSVSMVESLPATIVVARPFLFAIYERYSGTVLFMGKVSDPTIR